MNKLKQLAIYIVISIVNLIVFYSLTRIINEESRSFLWVCINLSIFIIFQVITQKMFFEKLSSNAVIPFIVNKRWDYIRSIVFLKSIKLTLLFGIPTLSLIVTISNIDYKVITNIFIYLLNYLLFTYTISFVIRIVINKLSKRGFGRINLTVLIALIFIVLNYSISGAVTGILNSLVGESSKCLPQIGENILFIINLIIISILIVSINIINKYMKWNISLLIENEQLFLVSKKTEKVNMILNKLAQKSSNISTDIFMKDIKSLLRNFKYSDIAIVFSLMYVIFILLMISLSNITQEEFIPAVLGFNFIQVSLIILISIVMLTIGRERLDYSKDKVVLEKFGVHISTDELVSSKLKYFKLVCNLAFYPVFCIFILVHHLIGIQVMIFVIIMYELIKRYIGLILISYINTKKSIKIEVIRSCILVVLVMMMIFSFGINDIDIRIIFISEIILVMIGIYSEILRYKNSDLMEEKNA